MAKRTVTSGVRTGRWAGKGPAAKAQMPKAQAPVPAKGTGWGASAKGKVYFEVPATAPVKSRAPRRSSEQKAADERSKVLNQMGDRLGRLYRAYLARVNLDDGHGTPAATKRRARASDAWKRTHDSVVETFYKLGKLI